MRDKIEEKKEEIEERVIQIDRISRTVSGGRRMRFRALVVVGNRNGKVGLGIAKGPEVAVAINKAKKIAKKNTFPVPIVNDTIPHQIRMQYGAAIVLLKPAAYGTSIIAGGTVRAIIELSGIKNIISKILGSSSKINNAKATVLALKSLRTK